MFFKLFCLREYSTFFFINEIFKTQNLLKKVVLRKKLSDINPERQGKPLAYIKNNLTDSDNNMYLTVDLLIDINNIENWFDQILL